MKIKRVKQSSNYLKLEYIVSEHELLTKYSPYYTKAFVQRKLDDIEDLYYLNISHSCAYQEGVLAIAVKPIDLLAISIIEQKEALNRFERDQASNIEKLREAQRLLGYTFEQRRQFNTYQRSGGEFKPHYNLLPLQRELYKIVEADRLEVNRLRAEKMEKDRAEKAKSLRLELCI